MKVSLQDAMCSGSVVRPIIPAFRAEDSGSNPGRSTKPNLCYGNNKFLNVFADLQTHLIY